MANWNDLKAAVAKVIKTNGNQEITGQALQNVLNNIVTNLGANATFVGIAKPSTNPGTPDGPVFYITGEAGSYPNFENKTVNPGLSILSWNGSSWNVATINTTQTTSAFGTSDSLAASQNLIAKATAYINVSQLYPTSGYTNTGTRGGDQYTLDEAVQLLRDNEMNSLLRTTLHGIIFVNRETKKYELWIFTGYTKIGDNYAKPELFRRVLSYNDYTSLLNEIESSTYVFNKINTLNLLSLNLVEKIEKRSFNTDTGAIGEEGSSSIDMIIVNLVGIHTTDIYFYNPFGKFHVNFKNIYYFDKYGTYVGSISFDAESSDNYTRHFSIPEEASKFVAMYITYESVFAKKIETCVPYGLTEREFNIRNSDFYRLGKTLNSVSIDISYKFEKLKLQVFLKADNQYRITSTFSGFRGKCLDVKGNKTEFSLGEVFIPQYDVYYIITDFVNTQSREASINIELVPEEIDISEQKSIKELTNLKIGKLPFNVRGTIRAGTINNQTGEATYSEEGTQKISEYVPIIPTPMIYVTNYIINIWFYDINKKYIGHGTAIKANKAYKSPEGAYYMIFERPFGNASGTAVNFGYVMTEDEYETSDDATIVNLNVGNKLRFSSPDIKLRNKTVYVIGDSEAARFAKAINPLDSLNYCAFSSFGGHSDDMISSNVGVSTTGNDVKLTSLKNAKVIIQSSTNGGDIPRLRAYILELIKNIRRYGATEIWGLSLCVNVNSTFEDLKNNGRYQMQRILFGGHFIDYLAAVYQMGVYYNLYHPKAFTQPALSSNVDIYFDDIEPFIELSNPIFAVGLDFYMQYYDDKYDVYTVASIDKENNKITATLKTNNSDIKPGGTAGQYTEKVTTSVWDGTKITKGYIYNEKDKTNIEQGRLPYNIYADHTVHYGRILGAIIKEMLYASGALEYEDELAVAYLNH